MQRVLCARDRPIRNARCPRQRVSGPAQRHPLGARPAAGEPRARAALRDVGKRVVCQGDERIRRPLGGLSFRTL